MIRIFTILSVIIMIILAGCSSDASRKAASALAVAEEIMDERPDSALTLLSDSALIPSDRRQKALYALLLTQARHKNFIDETNDSLIATAVDYFDKHHDNLRLMKSLFYQATINYNDQSFQPAMAIAMRADKIAKDLNDIYWQARIAELMGDIFSETYFYEEAVKHYSNSAALFKQANVEKAYLYNLGHLAISYENLRDYEKAIILADSIRKQTSSPYLIVYCANISSHSLSKLGRYQEANIFADTLLSYIDQIQLTSLNYSTIANIRMETGRAEEANDLLRKALETATSINDTLKYDLGLLRYYELTNNITDAYRTLENSLSLQNNVAENIRQQSSIIAQRDFYSQQATNAELKIVRNKYAIILLIVIAISIISILIILFRYKILRKNAEIELKIAQIQSISAEAEINESKLTILCASQNKNDDIIKDLNAKLVSSTQKQAALLQLSQSLLLKRLKQLNMLVNEFYEADNSKESRLAIYRNIEKEIKRITDKRNLKEIEAIINTCMDNIITNIRSQLSDFSNDEITLLTLSIAGYSARAISFFTGLKPSSVYSKRSRLVARIRESNAPDKAVFISHIEKPFA